MRSRRLVMLILAFLAATSCLFCLISKNSQTLVMTNPHYYQSWALQWRRESRIRNWCRNDIKMRNKSEELTALASFPGSGNTWLRYLLQQATGLATGSVYEDLALMHNGFMAENVANVSVLVVKTHETPSSNEAPRFNKALLLIRRPLEAIEAEFHRRAAGHLGHADRSKFLQENGRIWRDFVSTHLDSWQMFNRAWLKMSSARLKVVCYENLKWKILSELKKILNFLKVSHIVSNEHLRCTISRKEGWFRRRKLKFDFQLFNDSMRKQGFKAEMSLKRLLKKHKVNVGNCFGH